ncbi:MAG TPA: enoyl-CoA hydratase-related protein [Thermoleophilaceae bacterium]|nr:enoyl-CoA hydratase-related protein [Thermoleophilaceae bacterium]
MTSVIAEVRDRVGVARLDRPDARNALSRELMEELAAQLERWDDDPHLGCMVVAGSDEYFAAGADIKSMARRSFREVLDSPTARFWPRVAALRKPLVAAVSGYALGGGCELALACDMIVAAEGAWFGQPEITLGIIPGGGGTQRLARAIGKQRAMEYVLTGRRFDARTALAWGLVNQTAPEGKWLEAALELGRQIAAAAPLASRLAKQAVLAAEESDIAEGLRRERQLFEEAMASEDRVEGMRAFLEKRKPEFEGR